MKNISAATNSSSNCTFSSSTEDLSSKAKEIVWCSVFALESFLIVAGNLLTIVLFAVNKNLRKRSLLLVINMAFADVLIGVVCLPLFIYLHIGADDYQLWAVDSSHAFWVVFFYIITEIIFSQASLISSALISAERFYAVCWPLKHQILPMRAYCVVICIIWALSIIVCTVFLALGFLISYKHAFYTLMSSYLVLLFIVCGCNSGIWTKFQCRSIVLHHQNRGTQNRRLTKTLLFVSVLALLSLFPVICIELYSLKISPLSWYVRSFAFALCFLHSAVNPVVYALRIPEYRQALYLSCFKRQSVMNREDHCEKRNKRTTALGTVEQLRTLPNDPTHLQLAFEQDVMDTQL